jgi:outer membrane immunogenic protein
MDWSTDMKRAILFGIGLLTLTSLPAGAADMAARIPTKAPVMAPEPAWNWTGFYVGVNGGYGWANSTHTDVFGATTGSFKQNGGLIGGTIGYNWQTSPAVLGLEADLDWARINGSSAGCFSGSCFTNMQAFGTARGRLGYAINNWMPFIAGGAAFADIRAGQNGVLGTTGEQWRVGWTIGGGIEALFAPNWSAKIEYLYADFGNATAVGYTPVGGFAVSATERNVNIVRAGINYHFNWGGPVVARY